MNIGRERKTLTDTRITLSERSCPLASMISQQANVLIVEVDSVRREAREDHKWMRVQRLGGPA